MFHYPSQAVTLESPPPTTTGNGVSQTSNHQSPIPIRDPSKEEPTYFKKLMEFFSSAQNAECLTEWQSRALETLKETCSDAGGMNTLPSTKTICSCDELETELRSWLMAMTNGEELPIIARCVLVASNVSFQDENEYYPRYDRDTYLFIREINEIPCVVNGKISMDDWSDYGCKAFGRLVNIAVLLEFTNTDSPRSVLLQIASKDIGSSQKLLSAVAEVIPSLVARGLVAASFISNESNPNFLPGLYIDIDAIKSLAKQPGLQLRIQNFSLDETSQQYLNEHCNASLLFEDCTFAAEGGILLSKPEIELDLTFMGQCNAHFPSLIHLASTMEFECVAKLHMKMTRGAYKLNGEQDEKDLKRLCRALVRHGHRVVWGDHDFTPLGRFANEAEQLEPTVIMGLFDLSNLGTDGTRERVSSIMADAKKSM